jgi:hypothetical protein
VKCENQSEKIYHLVDYFNIDKKTIKKCFFRCLLGASPD